MSKKGCDRDCSTCDLSNRSYCAVQIGLKNQEMLLSLVKVLTPIIGQGSIIPPIPGGGDEDPDDLNTKE